MDGETTASRLGSELPPGEPNQARIQLIGGFRVTAGGAELEIPASSCRLVAFLALAHRPLERAYVANCLWLDKSEKRAHANLRSALWRLGKHAGALVQATPTKLRVAPSVSVDVDVIEARARALIDEEISVAEHLLDGSLFGADLLPEWYDDFVEIERERLRQLRLHALEALSRRLVKLGRYARALDVAHAAVAADPLRETAHRTVIEAHIAEGNISEAARQYRFLASILADQLSVEPSCTVRSLLSPFLASSFDALRAGDGPPSSLAATGEGGWLATRTGSEKPVIEKNPDARHTDYPGANVEQIHRVRRFDRQR